MSVAYTVERIGPRPSVGEKARRDFDRAPVTPWLKRRQEEDIASRLAELVERLALCGLDMGSLNALSAVTEFEATYAARPTLDNEGGMMRYNAFWLFALVRMLRPSLIIESGTWKGLSSWLMAEAGSGSGARLVSFDIAEHPERIENDRVEYRLGDWSEDPEFRDLPPDALVVLDDHIPHLRRLGEVHARGGRLAFVDDDYPATALHATGSPPVPTVAMLTDERLTGDFECAWRRDGKLYRHLSTEADRSAGRGLIAWSEPMPDLTRTGYLAQQGPATLVGLRG
ncbi:MAG: hypothetical protein HOH65_02085 [Rhodospirillaceae bacterium]|nr:hypothetical protein [Rhodospirillaceae bacterium]